MTVGSERDIEGFPMPVGRSQLCELSDEVDYAFTQQGSPPVERIFVIPMLTNTRAIRR